jgi:WD40 repeat protein
VDHAIRIWNVDTGVLSRTIDEYSVGLDYTSAVMHPDGRHVMENAGGRPTLWEMRSGRLVQRFEGRAFALSPDGAWVLTGGPDNLARLWATETGQLLRTLTGHTAEVMSVAFSPDGEQVLTGSADGTAKLWETATGQLRHTFEQHTPGGVAIYPVRGFSRDGRRVFTGPSWNGQTRQPLKVWDAATGQLVHIYANGSASFSRDMEHVLLFREDINQALVFEASTGEPVSTGHDEPGWRFLWDYPDRLWDLAQIANGDIETNRRVWEDLLWGFNAHELGELSTDRKWAVSRGGRLLLDAQWGILLRTFAVVGDSSIGSFSPNGHFLLTINNDGLGQVWDLRDRLAGIRTSRVGGKLELRWELGILQSAETVTGSWEDVSDAINPFAADVSAAAKFYRVKVEE